MSSTKLQEARSTYQIKLYFYILSNELSEKEMKTIPFTRASKNIKILKNKFKQGDAKLLH